MKKIIYIVAVCLVLISCGKGKNDDPDLQPEKAALLFPEQNAVCITGADVSETQSTVLFKWSPALNATGYEINVKNLLTGTSVTHSANNAEAAVSLTKNTPYSWFIVAKSSSGNLTAQSDTWKFYNSGNGVLSYAPFPADELSPATGQINPVNGRVTLNWKGSDADNDILNYDIYLGVSPDPPLYRKEITAVTLDNVPVLSKTIYYWRVVSRDAKGNTSNSDVVLFSVN